MGFSMANVVQVSDSFGQGNSAVKVDYALDESWKLKLRLHGFVNLPQIVKDLKRNSEKK